MNKIQTCDILNVSLFYFIFIMKYLNLFLFCAKLSTVWLHVKAGVARGLPMEIRVTSFF